MPKILILGGVTAEMAIEDNSEATTALITTLTEQGETNEGILRTIEDTMGNNETELKLLNARTEEAYETTITKEDLG